MRFVTYTEPDGGRVGVLADDHVHALPPATAPHAASPSPPSHGTAPEDRPIHLSTAPRADHDKTRTPR